MQERYIDTETQFCKNKKSYWKKIDIVLNAAYHVIKTSQTVSKETQPVRDNIDTAVLVMCKIDSSHRRFLCSTPQSVSKKGGYDTASVTCLHERVTCKLDFDQVHGTRDPVRGKHWAESATQPLNSQSADNAVARVSQFLPSSGPLETHSLQLEKQE